jgi:hypothetical protein
VKRQGADAGEKGESNPRHQFTLITAGSTCRLARASGHLALRLMDVRIPQIIPNSRRRNNLANINKRKRAAGGPVAGIESATRSTPSPPGSPGGLQLGLCTFSLFSFVGAIFRE